MATYELGSIPPLSVWTGDTLAFTVTSKLRKGPTFTKRATPSPAGKLTLDSNTGAFSYTPAQQDREEFALWIYAKAGKREEKQKILITPQARLNSDFNIIEHSAAAPDAASSLYIAVTSQTMENEVFNIEKDYNDNDQKARTPVRRVTVSGVRVVIEDNNLLYPVHGRLHNKFDIRELVLCADEVVFRSPLAVPGANVRIFARKLRFEQNGSLDTTPRPIGAQPVMQADGRRGQKGGDVQLYVRDIDMPGTAHRIIARGAKGQPAREGKAGDAGKSVNEWHGKANTSTFYRGTETLDWSDEIKSSNLDGYTAISAEIWEYAPGVNKKEWLKVGKEGQDVWPTDGEPPLQLPGRPGHGGDGGCVFSPFDAAQLASKVKLTPGDAGNKAKDVPASQPGKPVKSCMIRANYQKWVVPSGETKKSGDGNLNRKKGVEFLKNRWDEGKHITNAGAVGPAQELNPGLPAPTAGTLQPLDRSGTGHWMHPVAVRPVIAYANDLLLAGHNDAARVLVAEYLDACTTGRLSEDGSSTRNAGSALEWTALEAELSGLLQRVDGPYDFFGNPAGWVPMLSFETNLQLFNREVEDSIRTLFLVYWLEKTQATQQKARKALEQATARLDKETARALADYEAAQQKLVTVDVEMRNVLSDIKTVTKGVDDLSEVLRRQAQDDLELEHALRGSAKLLGGIAQIVPFGQPILGAIGKGVTVLGDIDLDTPASSLPDLAGAFSDVAEEKLLPKVKKLLFGLKSEEDAKKEEEEKTEDKKKFDEKLAKKQLAERVKTYMDEQKAAKKQVSDAFANFAVSEDEVNARLADVLSKTPQYEKMVGEIKDLNAKKSTLAASLLALMETIEDSATTVLNNQLARIEITAQLDVTIDQLNQEALQYAQAMGRRARGRLMRYQYYMLKSYQYLMLEDLDALDFRAQKMFEEFARLLAGSPDGSLTQEQFATVRAVFEDQLKQVTDSIIEWYNGHPPRSDGEFVVSLSDAQIATLNSDAGQLDIDLMQMGYLDSLQEDIRITGIETTTVELLEKPVSRAVNVNLQYRHSGVSRLRRGGLLYQFRSGDYRVTAESKEITKYRDDHMLWGAVVLHDGTSQSIKVTRPDPAEQSLVRYLAGNKRGNEAVLNFRPAAWAVLTIRRSATPRDYAGKISKLILKVSYVWQPVDDRLTTVTIIAPEDMQGIITCDKPDVNGRADGRGSFLRSFDAKRDRKVTLRAPARYGNRSFLGWRMYGDLPAGRTPAMMPLVKPGSNVQIDDRTNIVKEPVLVLDLQKQSAYTLEPLFAELAVKPAPVDEELQPRRARRRRKHSVAGSS